MESRIVLFEDREWSRLYPATLTRSSFEVRCGAHTLGGRLLAQLAARGRNRTGFLTRPLLRPLVERDHPGRPVNRPESEDAVFLNGRLLVEDDALGDLLTQLDKSLVVEDRGELLGVRLTGAEAEAFGNACLEALERGETCPFPEARPVEAAPTGAKLVRYLWDVVEGLGEVLVADAERLGFRDSSPELAVGAHVLGREHVISGDNVRVEPGAVVDARSGPVILGEGVHIQHHAAVLGPAFLGAGTVVKMGAKIEGPVAVGPVCKVGGEVERALFQGYGNKQHDGFLGHAFLGAWTNLGAATNNSDLKNTYATVRVWTPGGEVDTGQRFVGLFMGDHSKTAIGTLFNTGTVVGAFSNVFGAGFPPKHVPSFSWGGKGGPRYELEKALAVARSVMARRAVSLEPADEVLYRSLYAETQADKS